MSPKARTEPVRRESNQIPNLTPPNNLRTMLCITANLAAWFECNDMLAGGEDYPPERHHAFFTDRLANDRQCLFICGKITDFDIAG
jgi:hypothetical protein